MTITELEKCVDDYGKDIFNFCIQMTGNRQEGEDLYQDTFMKAVELLKKIDTDNNPKGYLLSIAVRLWKNKRRKQGWRWRIAGMESLDEKEERAEQFAGTQENLPEEEMLCREERALVRRCIRELNERYRIPVYLHYCGQLSVKETADCLKLPEGTVKSRLHKARTLIKEGLEASGYDK